MFSNRFSGFRRSVGFDFVLVREDVDDLRLGRALNAAVTYGVDEMGMPFGNARVAYGLSGLQFPQMIDGPGVGEGQVMDIPIGESPIVCGGKRCSLGVSTGCGHGGCGAAVFSPAGKVVWAVSSFTEVIRRAFLSLSVDGPPVRGEIVVEVDAFGKRCALRCPLDDAVRCDDSVFDAVVMAVAWPWARRCASAACMHLPVSLDRLGPELTTVWSPGGLRYLVGSYPADAGDDEVIELVYEGDEDLPGPAPGTQSPRSDMPTEPPPPYDRQEDEPMQANAEPDVDNRVVALPVVRGLSQLLGDVGDDGRLWRAAGALDFFGVIRELEDLALGDGESQGPMYARPSALATVQGLVSGLCGPLHPVRPPSRDVGIVLSPRWLGVLRVVFDALGVSPAASQAECGRWGPALLYALSMCGSDSVRAKKLLGVVGLLLPFLLLPGNKKGEPPKRPRPWRGTFRAIFPERFGLGTTGERYLDPG